MPTLLTPPITGFKFTELPAASAGNLSDIFAKDDLTGTPVTQKITLAQMFAAFQANFASVYHCTADPNAELISGFTDSVCWGLDGSLWRNSGVGLTTTWTKYISV